MRSLLYALAGLAALGAIVMALFCRAAIKAGDMTQAVDFGVDTFILLLIGVGLAVTASVSMKE